MFNFRYLKPYYTQSEVLELFSLSKSTLQRYREEVMKKGGDLWVDLGYFHIDGTKEAMYEPVRLSNWLLENKINIPKPYDYQVDEIKKVSSIEIPETSLDLQVTTGRVDETPVSPSSTRTYSLLNMTLMLVPDPPEGV